MLTPEMMQNRVAASQKNLNKWHNNPEDFLKRVIMVDKTWVHHFDPETKLHPSCRDFVHPNSFSHNGLPEAPSVLDEMHPEERRLC